MSRNVQEISRSGEGSKVWIVLDKSAGTKGTVFI